MKTSISQITNSIDRINRFRKCRKMVSALEDTTTETIQNKIQKEKYWKLMNSVLMSCEKTWKHKIRLKCI